MWKYKDHYYDGQTIGGVGLTIIVWRRKMLLRIERRRDSIRFKKQGGRRYVEFGR